MNYDSKPDLRSVDGEGAFLTGQERQLLAAFHSMSADARSCFVGMGESIARGSGAAQPPRLKLAHSRTSGTHQ